MSEEHAVSRRDSLKSLGVMGAAVALGPGAFPSPAGTMQGGSDQAKTTINVVDLAVARFGKGHS
jgi:hypothetical protein